MFFYEGEIKLNDPSTKIQLARQHSAKFKKKYLTRQISDIN
jgi:hypothetical protein